MITKACSYTEARDHLSDLIDETISHRSPIVINRRGKESVALLPVDELSSLLETSYLLRSPANARRLLGALDRVRAGKGKKMTLDQLQKSIG